LSTVCQSEQPNPSPAANVQHARARLNPLQQRAEGTNMRTPARELTSDESTGRIVFTRGNAGIIVISQCLSNGSRLQILTAPHRIQIPVKARARISLQGPIPPPNSFDH